MLFYLYKPSPIGDTMQVEKQTLTKIFDREKVSVLELVSLMDSDPSHCFSLLTARGTLSITSLWSTRSQQNSKPRRDFWSCDSLRTNCTRSKTKTT